MAFKNSISSVTKKLFYQRAWQIGRCKTMWAWHLDRPAGATQTTIVICRRQLCCQQFQCFNGRAFKNRRWKLLSHCHCLAKKEGRDAASWWRVCKMAPVGVKALWITFKHPSRRNLSSPNPNCGDDPVAATLLNTLACFHGILQQSDTGEHWKPQLNQHREMNSSSITRHRKRFMRSKRQHIWEHPKNWKRLRRRVMELKSIPLDHFTFTQNSPRKISGWTSDGWTGVFCVVHSAVNKLKVMSF